jgi:toxin YhaV
VFEAIPQDPTRAEYRQGDTLGEEHKHWCRAKFFQQYRLFFRYDFASRVIIFAWVNDDDSKRAYGSSDDAYRRAGSANLLGAGTANCVKTGEIHF